MICISGEILKTSEHDIIQFCKSMQSKCNETYVCVTIPKRLSPLEFGLQKHLVRERVSERLLMLQVLRGFVAPGARVVGGV